VTLHVLQTVLDEADGEDSEIFDAMRMARLNSPLSTASASTDARAASLMMNRESGSPFNQTKSRSEESRSVVVAKVCRVNGTGGCRQPPGTAQPAAE
jgi:hypothetical protein